MGDRTNGGTLLGVSGGLLFLTVVSTFMIFAAGIDWEPDEMPASYWNEQIPQRQWMMAFAIVVPSASAAAAVASTFARPRRPLRIVGAILVAAVALTALYASWVLGVEAVESAKYWASRGCRDWCRR